MIEYLGEIETEFENTLACLSGAQMGLNHEKNGGRTFKRQLIFRIGKTVYAFVCLQVVITMFALFYEV